MKNILLAVVLGLSTLQGDEVVSFAELNVESPQGEIVVFEEGSSLPVSFNLSGEVFSLDSVKEGSLLLHKSVYVKMTEEGSMVLSDDLENWAPFERFFTGEISLSTTIEEGENGLSMKVDLNKR